MSSLLTILFHDMGIFTGDHRTGSRRRRNCSSDRDLRPLHADIGKETNGLSCWQ